jgi:glycerol-3-phosphate O-acyltransferase/dihydroxyacetone phosphate acyltransferase
MDDYKEQFFSDLEGAPRAAAKRLTRAIERELVEATINAPDWYFNNSSLRCVRTLIMC